MDNFVEHAWGIFQSSIEAYHKVDNVDAPYANPYQEGTLDFDLYRKNIIDTIQWHLEDLIRDPNIEPTAALVLKRRIDASNQERTDLVERIDEHLLHHFANVNVQANATINTETPAWAIDRLSILALKIYHMQIEVNRNDAAEAHKQKCQTKLNVLKAQREDLGLALQTLLNDLAEGRKYMKTYKQMKMYNDTDLNPVLYNKKA